MTDPHPSHVLRGWRWVGGGVAILIVVIFVLYRSMFSTVECSHSHIESPPVSLAGQRYWTSIRFVLDQTTYDTGHGRSNCDGYGEAEYIELNHEGMWYVVSLPASVYDVAPLAPSLMAFDSAERIVRVQGNRILLEGFTPRADTEVVVVELSNVPRVCTPPNAQPAPSDSANLRMDDWNCGMDLVVTRMVPVGASAP